MQSKREALKIIATNRKAWHRFSIVESFEAGLVLLGCEVKSLRQGKISIDESLIRLEGEEMFLFNAYIPPYSHLSHGTYDPTRSRKLLMHRKELDRLATQVQAKRMTLVPLELYFKHGMAKVQVGLAKGKKFEDRREEIKKRESERNIRRNYLP